MSVWWGTGELSERASAGQAGPSDPHLFPSYRTSFSDGPCTKSALKENRPLALMISDAGEDY